MLIAAFLYFTFLNAILLCYDKGMITLGSDFIDSLVNMLDLVTGKKGGVATK